MPSQPRPPSANRPAHNPGAYASLGRRRSRCPSFTLARGQSIVELVLILPLLLMMILGVVDFSLAFTAHTKLRNAVAEGGYWAAQNPGDEDGVRSQVRSALQGLDPPVTDADITYEPCVEVDGEFQTAIGVRYNFPVIFGVFGSGSHIALSNSTTLPQFGGCR